jgi:hypothetical protein
MQGRGTAAAPSARRATLGRHGELRLGGDGTDRWATVVSHASRTIAFAAQADGIGYSVLNPGGENPEQDASWTDFSFLTFPRELRPVGRSVITVDFGADPIPVADAPFAVVSDNRYLYVFRQSTNATLYFDRFVFDEATGRIINAWEVRFRRSRKPDVPADKRDTFGSTDMTGKRFVVPTIELDFVTGVFEGRFAALVVPTELAGVDRWQLFAQNSATGRLDSFSIRRASDGSFDLDDAMDEDGAVVPERRYRLSTADSRPLTLATGPAATLYHQQEWLRDEDVRPSLQKLEARTMVALGTGADGAVAVLDFGVGREGRLARGPESLVVSAASEPGTALDFTRSAGTQVSLPSLVPAGAGATVTVEAWIAPRELSSGLAVIVQSAADAPAPFVLALRDGVPVFSAGAGAATAVIADRPLSLHAWTHVAGIWDAATASATIAVNGHLFTDEADPLEPPAPPAAGYVVGGAQGFDGQLDELRLWRTARTADELLATMSIPLTPSTGGWADLVGYWPLDEPDDATRTTTVPNASAAGAVADGALAGPRWVPTSAPVGSSLAPIAWDERGLTTATALLPFLATKAAPVLHDGADSLLHLYVSAAADQALLAAHCSPVVARAGYELTWVAADPGRPDNDEAGVVTMLARQTGTTMNATATTPAYVDFVAERPARRGAPPTATVTLRSDTGSSETWPAVPLALESFAAVLNGDAQAPSDDPAEAAQDAIVYDYARVTVVEAGGQRGPTPAPGTGSALFRALPDMLPSNGMPALVQPTGGESPALVRAGANSCWQAAPPLLDADLRELGQYFTVLDATTIASYDGPLRAPGDMAVEAWVKRTPNEMEEDETLLVYNQPGGPQYLVGIGTDGRPIAGNGDVVACADQVIPEDVWTHLAASYRTDYGIQLGGARYLDAGNDQSLDSADAVTLEAWVRLDAVGGTTQTIASKWDEQRGRSWRLLVDEQGRLACEVQQSVATGQVTRRATGTTRLAPGDWHHVAGVYDVAFERVVALMFDGGTYVNVPEVANPPQDGVTVAMWIKLVGSAPDENQTLMAGTDPTAALPFNLFLHGGVPTFTVWDGAEEHTISATTALRADDWLHIAGSYQRGRAIQLVVDGIPVAGSGATQGADGGSARPQAEDARTADAVEAAYTVGGQGSRQSLVGMVTELSLWNRGLTLDEIRQKIQQPLAATERGLCGYWRFNDLFGDTAMDVAGTANGAIVGARFVRVDKGAFAQKVFVDGRMEAFDRVLDPLVISEASVRIGSSRFCDYLQGAVGEVRLWKSGRMNWQIDYFATRDLESNAIGLIALWPFDTGTGPVAFDAKGDSSAVIRDGVIELTDEAIAAMWIRTTFKAGWTFYVDGAPVASLPAQLLTGGYGDAQATLCAVTRRGGAFAREMTGELQQVRVWRRQLSATEVRDRMYVDLTGMPAGLAACWPFDDGSGTVVTDRSGWGANATWVGDGVPAWQLSTAPVGDEAPQVRSVPGRIAIPLNASSRWACGVGGYGQLQGRPRAASVAVLKRAYAFVALADAQLVLLSGPALGDLDLQYVGQAQLAPTLIGYIEGPPPLPAENLKVYPGDPNGYLGASSLQLDETGSRIFTYSAGRDLGTDTNMSQQVGFTIEQETSAGLGVETEVFGLDSSFGLEVSVEESISTYDDAQVSEETAVTARNSVEVRGRWVENTYAVDGGVGELFYPSNVGYALVRSGTADVFAMRLRGSGALVGYTTRPNPDIPEDLNVISFQMRASYVKNGTLDGWIGYEPDNAYRFLTPGERGSYFKPLQAYALKQSIEREAQQRKTWFDNFDAVGLGQRDGRGRPGRVDIAESDRSLANVLMGVDAKAGLSSEEWKARMARRNLVNTYVWTAEGGLYSEQEQYIAVREESTGGAYSMTSRAGIYTDFSLNIGPSFSLSALFGSHIATQATKADREQWQYQLDVMLSGERYVGLITEDGGGELVYGPDPSPGKVRGYRFMTFQLAPSQRNFEDFEGVVDEDWLYGTGAYAGRYDPDALALRQALANPNETWRVLHRVTYVSRVPPQQQDAGESLAADVRRPDEQSVLANLVLIGELPTDLANPNPMAQVSVEADALLAELEQQPVWGERLRRRRAETKQDVMAYMASYYGIPTT